MVVNAMIVATVTHANQQNQIIYQVGSSLTNPIHSSTLGDLAYNYFSKNPWINTDGTLVRVRKAKLFTTAASFQGHMALHYQLPLRVILTYFQHKTMKSIVLSLLMVMVFRFVVTNTSSNDISF